MFSIQQIFSHFKDDFFHSFHLSFAQMNALNHITSCRTPSLGGFVSSCPDCNASKALFHSCRDRNCPICQGNRQKAWTLNQMHNALPIKYIVFTVPASLNALFYSNQKLCYDLLFDASSQAIFTLCKNSTKARFQPGFTSVLHTWGQTLQYHPHIHMIIPAGGLSLLNNQFVNSSNKFFLPVKQLSVVFRAILLKKIKSLFALDPALIDQLYKNDFVIHIEKPFDSPDNLIKYLARYTQKVAVSDSRIRDFDPSSGMVSFSYQDNRDGGKQKIMSLHALEFMRRFFLHVLPRHFTKIRHYGFLANRCKHKNIDLCFKLLGKARSQIPHKSVSLPVCSLCGSILCLEHFNARDFRIARLKAS